MQVARSAWAWRVGSGAGCTKLAVLRACNEVVITKTQPIDSLSWPTNSGVSCLEVRQCWIHHPTWYRDQLGFCTNGAACSYAQHLENLEPFKNIIFGADAELTWTVDRPGTVADGVGVNGAPLSERGNSVGIGDW
jgi:hypothetical protein